jgi:protein-S-isoprenylcysteine O-methyltransferase Ste14
VRRPTAAAGSAAFFALAPGVVAGVVPWALTRWDARAWWLPLRVVGVVVLAAAAVALVHAFARFVLEGLGTPAPIAPADHLVVGGPYRFVRNPMYLAVVGAVAGQALVLGRVVLLAYAGVLAVVFGAFVHLYEEPTLRRQFGDDYEGYRRAVSAWLPRLRPWRG